MADAVAIANAVEVFEDPEEEGPDLVNGQWVFKTRHYKKIPVTERGAIRILRVQAGSPDQLDVICELVSATIVDPWNKTVHWSTQSIAIRDANNVKSNNLKAIPYDALSWCWGKDGGTAEIKIKEGRRQYVKYVQSSPVEALRALRRKTHDLDL